MPLLKKKIRLSGHATERLKSRGCSENEINQAIQTSKWTKAESNKWECKCDFSFGKIWNGKNYTKKQVRPIFVEEENEIVVVTVYTYYSNE